MHDNVYFMNDFFFPVFRLKSWIEA